MSKLYKLRPFLDFEQAAELLSSLIDEEIDFDDIYELHVNNQIRTCFGGTFIGVPAWPPATDTNPTDLWLPVEIEMDRSHELFAHVLHLPHQFVETPLGKAPINMVEGLAYIWFKLIGDYNYPMVKSLDCLGEIDFSEDLSVTPCEILRVASIANGDFALTARPEDIPKNLIWSMTDENVRITHTVTPLERRAEITSTASDIHKHTDKPSTNLVIFALLEILGSKTRNLNQSAVISEILERFPSTRGLSKRNLESIFGAANKASKHAE